MKKDGLPKQFQLMGHTIKVCVVSKKKWQHGDDAVGCWIPDAYRIEILNTAKGSARQQIFTHEAFHAMLDLAAYDELSKDESFVDQMGHLLQQMLTTME